MAKCGDASTSPHLTMPTALPELKAREGGDFREGPPPNTQGGFGGRGGGGCELPTNLNYFGNTELGPLLHPVCRYSSCTREPAWCGWLSEAVLTC